MTYVDTLSFHRNNQHVINEITIQKKNGQDSISNACISLTTKISRFLSESLSPRAGGATGAASEVGLAAGRAVEGAR